MGKQPALDKIEVDDPKLDDDEYERRLKKLQNRLLDLQIHDIRPCRRHPSRRCR